MVEIAPLQSVSLNSYLSRKFYRGRVSLKEDDCLQLPPSLLVINDLILELPRGVKAAIYVNNTDVPGLRGDFLFDLILYVPSTIFQLNRDGSSWVEPVLS